MPIKHLVLSGGGARGFATLGTLNYLIKKGVIDVSLVRTFVGSSVGALAALFLNCGYTPKQLYDIGLNLDLRSMFDPDIKNLITHFGFDTGIKFVDKIKRILIKKNIDPNITFLRLYNLTKQKLIITATSLNRKQVKYFDYITTPQYRVIDVIRASISVPFLFTTVKSGNEHFVDGGMLDNFPLHLFKDVPPHEVLAIKFRKTREIPEESMQFSMIHDLADAAMANLSCLLEEIEHLRSLLSGELYNKSCIVVDTGKYHMLSFNISKKDKQKMFRMGRKAAKKYINTNVYIKLRVGELPHKIQSIIYKYVHADGLRDVHTELVSKTTKLSDS
jgi:NTE family protein